MKDKVIVRPRFEEAVDPKKVVNSLRRIAKDNGVEGEDLDFITVKNFQEGIRRLSGMGFTVDELIAYYRNTEEVNPDLDEDTALKRMKAIMDKVKKRTGKR